MALSGGRLGKFPLRIKVPHLQEIYGWSVFAAVFLQQPTQMQPDACEQRLHTLLPALKVAPGAAGALSWQGTVSICLKEMCLLSLSRSLSYASLS